MSVDRKVAKPNVRLAMLLLEQMAHGANWKEFIAATVNIAASKEEGSPDVGNGILHEAARCGVTEILADFIDRENVNCHDKYRRTPLHFAALYGQAEDCRILLSKGATTESTDSNDRTPLHLALMAAEPEPECRLEVVRQLIDSFRAKSDNCYGIISQQRDEDGNTALHIAAGNVKHIGSCHKGAHRNEPDRNK